MRKAKKRTAGSRRLEVSLKEQAKGPVNYSIDERIAAAGRGEREHVVYLGMLVERTLKGEFGAILKALTAGRISIELDSQKESKRGADYHMGRASMGNDLWHDFEQFVLDKDTMLKPLPVEDEEGRHLAEDPNPHGENDLNQ